MSSKTSIIHQLSQNFNLSKNQTDILLLLCQKDLTAAQILKNSKVSNGRIYRLLTELVSLGLIDKIITSDKTATYSMKNFTGNIHNFLDTTFTSSSQKISDISKLLSNLNDHTEAQVIYGSKKEFDLHIIDMLNTSRNIKILHKHQSLPWFLYLHDEQKFLKVRNLISKKRSTGSSPNIPDLLLKRSAYLKAYQKCSFCHIFSQNTFEEYKKVLDLGLLKSNLKNYPNVQLYIIKNMTNPFSTYISDNLVLQPLFFDHKSNRILKLRGQDLTSTYSDYFEKYKQDSTSLSTYLSKHR